MTMNSFIAVTLRYFDEFGKLAFQLIKKPFLQYWTYWSKVNFYNTYSGEVSVRN